MKTKDGAFVQKVLNDPNARAHLRKILQDGITGCEEITVDGKQYIVRRTRDRTGGKG